MVSNVIINRRLDFFMRQMQGEKGEPWFWKIKAKLLNEATGKEFSMMLLELKKQRGS